MKRLINGLLALAVVAVAGSHAVSVYAMSEREIEIKVDAALDRFRKEVSGGDEFLSRAKGVLVFPSVVKAGVGIGGEYGEGALRIRGKTTAYYNTAAASFGLQFGAQTKIVMLVFLEQSALDKFRLSSGWEVGVDGSVAMIKTGVGGSLGTLTANKPIAGFVFGNKGLMLDVSLDGSKITKISN